MNKISEWIVKKYKVILLLSIIVFALSFLGVSRLGVSSNMEQMLPSDSEALKAGSEFDRYFESQDSAIVVVQGNPELCKQYLIDLEKRLLDEKVSGQILYRLNREELKEFALLYLDKAFYEKLEKAIDAGDMAAVNQLLQGLEGIGSEEEAYEYLANKEETTYMMLVKPIIDKTDFVGSRQKFYDGLKNAINSTLADPQYKDLEAGLTGGAFIQDIEADSVAFDGFTSTFLITLGLIILLIILSYRRILLPLSFTYPLLLGTCAAAAIAYLIYGSLNMFSVSFALLLIGLGIDFAIHLISRYLEERHNGLSVSAATSASIKETGVGIFIGALTTAIAFLAFVAARFKAFEQMGIISSLGIMVLCLLMLFIIPALIQLFDAKKKEVQVKKVEFGFLNALGNGVSKRPLITILIVFILVPVFLMNVSRTRIIGDIDKIYPSNMDCKKWEAIVTEAFDYNPNVMNFMVDDENMLKKCTEALKDQEGIDSVQSALDYLPEDQDYKLSVLGRLYVLLQNAGHPQAEYFKVNKMTISDLPETIKSNYLGKEGKLLVEVVPSINVYQQDNYRLIEVAIQKASGRLPVGMPAIMNEVVTMVQSDIITICIICFVAILLFLFLTFRSFKSTIICTIPVVLTLYLTLGILPLTGRGINVFSIAAFPLIIGIGIDSSIHLLHRLISEKEKPIGYIVMHTGKAILLTSLTTLLGFGSLAFINHPGMSNLGVTVALGMIICLIMTLVFIPAAFALLLKKKEAEEVQSEKRMVI